MIVRIMTEGQFEVSEDVVAKLNEIDGELEAAVAADDNGKFRDAVRRIHEIVAANGKPVEGDGFPVSDAILPDPELSIDEARWMLKEDGLIPG